MTPAIVSSLVGGGRIVHDRGLLVALVRFRKSEYFLHFSGREDGAIFVLRSSLLHSFLKKTETLINMLDFTLIQVREIRS